MWNFQNFQLLTQSTCRVCGKAIHNIYLYPPTYCSPSPEYLQPGISFLKSENYEFFRVENSRSYISVFAAVRHSSKSRCDVLPLLPSHTGRPVEVSKTSRYPPRRPSASPATFALVFSSDPRTQTKVTRLSCTVGFFSQLKKFFLLKTQNEKIAKMNV